MYLRHVNAVCTGKALVTSNKDSPWNTSRFCMHILKYHTEAPLVCRVGLFSSSKGNPAQRNTTEEHTYHNKHKRLFREVSWPDASFNNLLLLPLPTQQNSGTLAQPWTARPSQSAAQIQIPASPLITKSKSYLTFPPQHVEELTLACGG